VLRDKVVRSKSRQATPPVYVKPAHAHWPPYSTAFMPLVAPAATVSMLFTHDPPVTPINPPPLTVVAPL